MSTARKDSEATEPVTAQESEATEQDLTLAAPEPSAREPETVSTALERPTEPVEPVLPGVSESSGPRAVVSLGRYRLVRKLGEGGFGAVYAAHDPVLDREVAVKIPRALQGGDEIDDFLKEARRLAQLKHPGILTVHDVGQEDDCCYIVTDLLEGQSLASLLQERRRLTWPESANLVASLADALGHAHAQSMIHRDVKPGNIFITKTGQPVLLDFGLALTDLETSEFGDGTVGTPAYMAPEQARGEANQVDGRTDIYSLAVVLYTLLCGRTPFRATSRRELLRKILAESPQPPRQLVPEIPPELEQICMRGLAKAIGDRFATAADFALALRQVVAGVSPSTMVALQRAEAAAAPGDSSSKNSAPSPSSRRRREAVRRQVTLLVLNFEVVAEDSARSADADLQHELAGEFHECASRCAVEHGGSIVAAGGQELLICFGFPVAYEDAAYRGVCTAVEVVKKTLEENEARAKSLKARVSAWGIVHTGEAVVDETAVGENAATSLFGDVRTTASRLEPVVAQTRSRSPTRSINWSRAGLKPCRSGPNTCAAARRRSSSSRSARKRACRSGWIWQRRAISLR